MFELSDNIEVTVITDIGIDRRSAVIIDNIYKSPEEVREFVSSRNKYGAKGGMPGDRVIEETCEVKEILKPLFDDLCFDQDVWGKPTDRSSYEEQWDKAIFMCNIINDETIKNNLVGLIPHQDNYRLQPMSGQFGVVIYLNTPEECKGGTSIWSMEGQMSIDNSLYPYLYHIRNESYDTIQSIMDLKFRKECLLEMKYNRAVMYPTDILHSAELKLGWFSDYSRIAQVLFL